MPATNVPLENTATLAGGGPNARGLSGTTPRTWRFAQCAVVSVALFLCVSGLIVYRTLVGLNVPGKPQAPAWGMQDFRDAIYFPAVAFLEGNNPYASVEYASTYPVGNTFPLYLPLALLLHLPLALLPFKTAEVVYLLTTAALTPLIAFLSLRLCGRRASITAVSVVATLILMSRPGYWNLYLGQYTATLVLASYAALYFARPYPRIAALALAITTLKPTFGLPLAILMLAQGHVRLVLAGIATSGAVCAGVAAVIVRNVGGIVPFLVSLQSSHDGFTIDPEVNPATSTYRVDAVALFSRLIGEHVPVAGEMSLLIGTVGLAVWALRRLGRREDQEDARARSLGVGIICATILVCTYHQTYDLLLLAAPATALATGVFTAESPRWQRRALGLALALLASNYLVSGTALGRLGIRDGWRTAITSTNGLALMLVLTIYLTWALRAASRSTSVDLPGRLAE